MMTYDQMKLLTPDQLVSMMDHDLQKRDWSLIDIGHVRFVPGMMDDFSLIDPEDNVYCVRTFASEFFNYSKLFKGPRNREGYELSVYVEPVQPGVELPKGTRSALCRLGRLFDCDVIYSSFADVPEGFRNASLVGINPDKHPLPAAIYVLVRAFVEQNTFRQIQNLPMKRAMTQHFPHG